jgi:hypothetical protein
MIVRRLPHVFGRVARAIASFKVETIESAQFDKLSVWAQAMRCGRVCGSGLRHLVPLGVVDD